MRLQNRLHLLGSYWASVVLCIEGVAEGPLTVGVEATLATLTGPALFVDFEVFAKWTFHLYAATQPTL